MNASSFSYQFLHNGPVHVPLENRVYKVKIVAPHVFTQAIEHFYPRFANRYAVNIGAGDGVSCNDPAYPLYKAGYSGLAIDADTNAELAKNLFADSIQKVQGQFVTPMNVAELLAKYGCPQCPDFFKLDIDGYDGPVLLEVLKAGYRPKVMQLEINPEIPPPIEFAVLYDPRYRVADGQKRIGGFYGASLSYVCNLAAHYGYQVAQLDFVSGWTHDVTLVHENYWRVACKLIGTSQSFLNHREMYISHPVGYSHFREYGINSLEWRYREDFHPLAGEIWLACAQAGQMKHGVALPFHLTVA